MGSLFSLLFTWSATTYKPSLYTSRFQAEVALKNSLSTVSLKEFVLTKCPSLIKEFKPAWWLFNGHLQTAYCVAGDFSKIDHIVYERRLLRLPDGGTLGLDFAGPTVQHELDPETPIVVVMHGLTGGSYESYVRSILSFACSSKENGGLGYRGVVINFRGCAGLELTSAQFYSAGYTDDLRTGVFYLGTKFPRAKMLGIGFSLGANVLTRYLGEEGKNSRMVSGCVLACPWNLVKNSENLEGHWFSRTFYSKAMGRNLHKLFSRHVDTLRNLGPTLLSPNIDAIMASTNSPLVDMDELLVRLVGGSSPPFPFATARLYYEWASSDRHVDNIRVPFLAINAQDDPIVTEVPIPVTDEASHTVIVVTKCGGHLGWFRANKKAGQWAVERWVKQPVCEWLKATGEDLAFDLPEPDTVEEVDGFTRSVHHPKIGYREVGISSVVAESGATGTLAGL